MLNGTILFNVILLGNVKCASKPWELEESGSKFRVDRSAVLTVTTVSLRLHIAGLRTTTGKQITK